MTINKARKKPVMIEFIEFKYNDEGRDLMKKFLGDNLGKITKARTPKAKAEAEILTLEDGHDNRVKHIATEGDIIIKGVNGEFYPCKPDIFDKTYYKNQEINKSDYLDRKVIVTEIKGDIVSQDKCNDFLREIQEISINNMKKENLIYDTYEQFSYIDDEQQSDLVGVIWEATGGKASKLNYTRQVYSELIEENKLESQKVLLEDWITELENELKKAVPENKDYLKALIYRVQSKLKELNNS